MENRKEFCTIDITSHGIYLRIYQQKGNFFNIIDKADYYSVIGRDIFSTGIITFEKIREIVNVVTNMQEIVNGYKIKDIELYATTAVREAENSDYLQDQIKINTNLDLIIYDKLEENYLAYKQINSILSKEKYDYVNQTNLILYVGSGSVSLAISHNNKFIHNVNIEIGSLKLSEIIGKIEYSSRNKNEILEEYINKLFDNELRKIPKSIEINNIFISGRFYNLILEKMLNKKQVEEVEKIKSTDLLNYYNKVKNMSLDSIANDYGLKEEQVDVIIPKINIAKKLIERFRRKKIFAINFNLSDSVAHEYFFPAERDKTKTIYQENSIEMAKIISKKFYYDENHVDYTENIIDKIFNKLKKQHGLSKKELLFLKIVNIFKDTGLYISSQNYTEYSYDILLATDILGFNQKDRKVMGYILKYYQQDITRIKSDKSITKYNKVLIAKLVSILKISNSFDFNYDQKIKNIKIEVEKNEILFKVYTNEKIYLEKLDFEIQKKVFENVFGLKAKIKRIKD